MDPPPPDRRCKRVGNSNRRCSAMALSESVYCEKHHLWNKVNSDGRREQKRRNKEKTSSGGNDIVLESKKVKKRSLDEIVGGLKNSTTKKKRRSDDEEGDVSKTEFLMKRVMGDRKIAMSFRKIGNDGSDFGGTSTVSADGKRDAGKLKEKSGSRKLNPQASQSNFENVAAKRLMDITSKRKKQISDIGRKDRELGEGMRNSSKTQKNSGEEKQNSNTTRKLNLGNELVASKNNRQVSILGSKSRELGKGMGTSGKGQKNSCEEMRSFGSMGNQNLQNGVAEHVTNKNKNQICVLGSEGCRNSSEEILNIGGMRNKNVGNEDVTSENKKQIVLGRKEGEHGTGNGNLSKGRKNSSVEMSFSSKKRKQNHSSGVAEMKSAVSYIVFNLKITLTVDWVLVRVSLSSTWIQHLWPCMVLDFETVWPVRKFKARPCLIRFFIEKMEFGFTVYIEMELCRILGIPVIFFFLLVIYIFLFCNKTFSSWLM